MEARKAQREALGLALYALAQARAKEIERVLAERCAGCPGPEAPGGCLTRGSVPPVAGRSDWPVCPRGLVRVRAWVGAVDLYAASLVSALVGFPDALTAWAFDAMLVLRTALHDEQERQIHEKAEKRGSPQFSGRKTARVTA